MIDDPQFIDSVNKMSANNTTAKLTKFNLPGGNVKVPKNVIVSYPSDGTGCGHIRNLFPLGYLNAVYAAQHQLFVHTSPMFCWQDDILVRSSSIYMQRAMSPGHLEAVKRYKSAQSKYKYKLVTDMDDFIWGANENQGGTKFDGVPSYNFGSEGISPEIKKASLEIMNLMDTVCVSTDYLKSWLTDHGVTSNIEVVPNTVAIYFWDKPFSKAPKTNYIQKPKVLYTGSPTHYSNGKKLLGDFDNAWKQWVIDAVNQDKIEFVCMGGLPWFFEEIKDKIKVIDWLNSYQYHVVVKEQNADFGICPLTPNNFNYSKSDLKQIEYYASGSVCIGTVFDNGMPSPYDSGILNVKDTCTVDDIWKIVNDHRNPDKYNEVIKQQYTKMIQGHRYTEDPVYINQLLKIFA